MINPVLDEQTFKDGKMVWKVLRLIMLAKELEPFDIPLHHLNIHHLHPAINTTNEFVSHIKRVIDADMSCPIILDEEGYVMDGRHRVAKALLEKHNSIKAVRFETTPTCCYEEVTE